MRLTAAAGLLLLLCACVSTTPDHFYVLSAVPPTTGDARPAPTAPAALKLTLPTAIDRPQMVLNTSDEQVVILEHERWAAPLGELSTQALARDIEHRHGDILISADGNRAKGVDLAITVDVVQMTVHQGGQLRIDAHWHIVDLRSGKDVAGADHFSAPVAGSGYAAVARSLSECLGLLADRLVQQIP